MKKSKLECLTKPPIKETAKDILATSYFISINVINNIYCKIKGKSNEMKYKFDNIY